MDANSLAKSLHPLEVRVLLGFESDETVSAALLESRIGFNTGQANQALSWLEGKEVLVEKTRETKIFYELTEGGAAAAEQGTPEERIFKALKELGPQTLPALAQSIQLENKDVGSAFGNLSKAKIARMNADKQAELLSDALPQEVLRLSGLLKSCAARADKILAAEALDQADIAVLDPVSKKRGAGTSLFRLLERETVVFAFTPLRKELIKAVHEAGITGEEVNSLSAAMLKDGSWRKKTFRPFNIAVQPARLSLGRRNAYCEFLDQVKDRLVGFGFEEFDGSLVETEFWNSDALFMPQFHSARDIHDVYYVDEPRFAKEIEQPYLDAIAKAHENGAGTGSRGWNYSFDRDFTRRLILRSQGTVMSARTLSKAKIPGKYFGVLRCFRYDQVDATHLSDFYQTEGIVLGEDVNLRNLLGLLKMFAEELAGATEVKYVPGYFPFTEPSVEVHIKHPVLGWFELGGAGIFRPEVTKPMGVDVPVLAWGLGIDRMALMHLGINDLRELFSSNIENVRLRRQS